MVHLIVGYGEVGQALHKVLGKAYWYDREWSSWDGEPVDVIHICFPYYDGFNKAVEEWKLHAPLVIVHSSVPVGTCDALKTVHSPIRGVHPHLAEGIRTFYKYFGGKNAHKAASIFYKLGIPTRVYKYARTTEAIKLWDTTQYGKLIMMEKEIYEWCKKHKVDFEDVYIQANMDYNNGYVALGMYHVVRPYLKHMKGPIGGHCVIPNAKLLGIEL
jgi:UDP-N-acetyl-D-mannosaminuronate dehydrogenase